MNLSALRPSYFAYAFIFCVCFIVQMHGIALHMLDGDLWSNAVERTAAHLMRARQDLSPGRIDPVYLYPGTTVVLPASGLARMGVGALTSLGLTLATLISFAVCGVVALCARLRPRAPWWIAVAALFITAPYYDQSTLASALAIPFLSIVALSVLWVYERTIDPPAAFPWLFGLLGGVVLATRLDVGLLVFATALLALVPRLRGRVFISGGTAVAAFVALDPFLWKAPVSYFTGIYASIRMMQASPSLLAFRPTTVLFHTSPVAFISFALACALLLLFPRVLPVPRNFIAWLILVSIAMYAVVTLSPFWQPWYMYPFFILWEMMFPLLLFAALEGMRSDSTRRVIRPALFTALVFVFLIFTRVYLLLFGSSFHL